MGAFGSQHRGVVKRNNRLDQRYLKEAVLILYPYQAQGYTVDSLPSSHFRPRLEYDRALSTSSAY